MKEKMKYCGFGQDSHGLTMLGRAVLDGWVFGLLPDSEDCAGWDLPQMQRLMAQVDACWDQHGNLPSRLPPELQLRHAERYAWATERGKALGWNPELAPDE